jgi:hypothetical protein
VIRHLCGHETGHASLVHPVIVYTMTTTRTAACFYRDSSWGAMVTVAQRQGGGHDRWRSLLFVLNLAVALTLLSVLRPTGGSAGRKR